jgi:hypothetical protein
VDRTWLGCSGTAATSGADVVMQPDMDGVVTPFVTGRRLINAALAFRAGYLADFPVNDEGGHIEALTLLGLPTDIRVHGAEQFNVMPGLAVDQQVGIDITGIDKVGGGC